MNNDINTTIQSCLDTIHFSLGSNTTPDVQLVVKHQTDNSYSVVTLERPKQKGVPGLFGMIDTSGAFSRLTLVFVIQVDPNNNLFRYFELDIAHPNTSPLLKSFNEYHNEDDSRTPVPFAEYPSVLNSLKSLFQSNPIVTPVG